MPWCRTCNTRVDRQLRYCNTCDIPLTRLQTKLLPERFDWLSDKLESLGIWLVTNVLGYGAVILFALLVIFLLDFTDNYEVPFEYVLLGIGVIAVGGFLMVSRRIRLKIQKHVDEEVDN